MTLLTRRILFYALAVLFVAAGIIAIFYSSGWRFDLETFEINKLGALFLEVTPEDAVITIDKTNFEFKPGLLRSGTLIANLFPKTYTVKVAKEGYQPWIKELDVQPSLVAEVPPVILLPEKPVLEKPIKENIADFWVGPEYLITANFNGVLKFKSGEIFGDSVHSWSLNGESVITKSGPAYFLINLRKPQSALNLNLMLKDLAPVRNIDFSPVSNQLIALTENGLYALDANSLIIENLHQGNAEAFNSRSGKIIYAAGGNIWAYNPAAKSKELLISQTFQNVKDVQVSPSGYYLSILESGGALYIFDRKSLALTRAADNATAALFSPDSEKIAITADNKELIIYFPEDGSKALFSLGGIEKETMAWHKNSAYLFIRYPSSLYLLGTDNLPPINFQMVDLENKKYYYEPDKDLVYLLKGDSLYKFDLK